MILLPDENSEEDMEEPVMVGCVVNKDCAGTPDTPVCDASTGECVVLPDGNLIGVGDGSASSVEMTTVFEPEMETETPDLAFHPERDELWLVNRRELIEGECTPSFFNPRCQSLAGFTTIIFNPGGAEQSAEVHEDGNSWHFMRRPPAIAMGDNGTFGTCGEMSTGNYEDSPGMFIGPTLWSSDLDVYAQPSGGNGSHLDMLHATPWCMGIEHERDNIYWTFNGHIGSIDRYNFNEDHGPGNDDHSDGEIYRYIEGEVLRVSNAPSHMVFYDADAHLYIADTGNGRIIKLDTTAGEKGEEFDPVYEPLKDYGHMENTVVTEVVAAGGELEQPSGLAIHDGVLYVSDHATSKLHAYDMDGNLLRSLDTELPERSLAGIEVGPDSNLWFTNMITGAVVRIDIPEKQLE